jgi:hypothetical protein
MRSILLLLLSLIALGCQKPNAESARRQLERAGVAFSEEEFAIYVFKSDTRGVERFIAGGMDPNVGSALVYAAHRGNYRMVRNLLKAGADPNVVDPDGFTALSYAANYAWVSREHMRIARLLVEHGARGSAGKSGTPREVAAGAPQGTPDLLRILEAAP